MLVLLHVARLVSGISQLVNKPPVFAGTSSGKVIACEPAAAVSSISAIAGVPPAVLKDTL